MANVNEQITDAVTQTNVKVLAEAPAQAMATLYQVATQANGISMQNATSNQQNLNQLNPIIVAEAIKLITGGGGSTPSV
ncbi:MAG: RebB family R body protein [Bacteroidota bacterium]